MIGEALLIVGWVMLSFTVACAMTAVLVLSEKVRGWHQTNIGGVLLFLFAICMVAFHGIPF